MRVISDPGSDAQSTRMLRILNSGHRLLFPNTIQEASDM